MRNDSSGRLNAHRAEALAGLSERRRSLGTVEVASVEQEP